MLSIIKQVKKKSRLSLKWAATALMGLSIAVAMGCSDDPIVVEKIVEVEKVVVEEKPAEVVFTATTIPASEATVAANHSSMPAPAKTPAPTASRTPAYIPAPTATPASVAGRIAFVSDRDGNEEIYVINTDGSDVTRLTDNEATDEGASWSPDGLRIAFVSYRGLLSDFEIYVMNADGSDVRRLTHGGRDIEPSWSPDGLRIAFASYRGLQFDFEIYVMNADGSDVRRLTHGGRNADPSWSPDGRRIARSTHSETGTLIFT